MPKRKTQEEFIADVKSVWGEDVFDLSLVHYINNHTSVIVKCNKCGEVWEPKPDNLLHGHGCPTCAGCRKHTLESFIKKAREIHGNKYGYSKVVWNGRDSEVTVTCPVHGDFRQTPRNHLHGNGCHECAKLTMGSERLSLEDFLRRAKEIHGDEYDYSLVKHIKNNREKLPIVCKKHGVFMQSAHAHLDAGQGCRECGKYLIKEKLNGHGRTKRGYNTEVFIEKARKVHGDTYDYSMVDFKDHRTPVTIICKKHGSFSQVPYYHLAGNGCRQCYDERRTEIIQRPFEQFVVEARAVHGNDYEYDEASYKGSKKKMKIYCKKCQRNFLQMPYNHINMRQGCPRCQQSQGEKRVEMKLIAMSERFVPQYKIAYKDGVVIKRGGIYVDFYIPEKRTFIEFNGSQHYKASSRFGGVPNFTRQQKRDQILRRYCATNGYKLIEIPYTDFDRIEEILEKELRTE